MFHVVIDANGQFVSADDGFCKILQMERSDILARKVLEVTAPADREECQRAIEKMQTDRQPFTIVKRLIREDGTLFWAKNTVSMMMQGSGPPTIVASVEPFDATIQRVCPSNLLDCARFLAVAAQAREMVCSPILLIDRSWGMLLVAYIAEAEGRPFFPDHAEPNAMLNGRWIAAMMQHDLLEIEYRDGDAATAISYRLTANAHRDLEAYLTLIEAMRRSGASLDPASP